MHMNTSISNSETTVHHFQEKKSDEMMSMLFQHNLAAYGFYIKSLLTFSAASLGATTLTHLMEEANKPLLITSWALFLVSISCILSELILSMFHAESCARNMAHSNMDGKMVQSNAILKKLIVISAVALVIGLMFMLASLVIPIF